MSKGRDGRAKRTKQKCKSKRQGGEVPETREFVSSEKKRKRMKIKLERMKRKGDKGQNRRERRRKREERVGR